MKELYKLDSKGKLRSWSIHVEDLGNSADIVTIAGLVDGEKVPTRINISKGKNIGKSNETNYLEQAELEAQSKWDLKFRGEYVDDLSKVTQATLGAGTIKAPMLAKIYHPTAKQNNSKSLDQWKLSGKRIAVQPKIDGNRCLAKISLSGVELYTRTGIRFLPINHLQDQLFNLYKLSPFYGQDVTLDGELFSHEFSFNTLNGLLKRETKSEEDLESIKSINYYIYDIFSDDYFEKRFSKILSYFNNNLNCTVLKTKFITASDENIRENMDQFLSEGHEGLMIRGLESSYEHKRSNALLKYKDFMDSEYELLDILPDRRGDFVGKFIMKPNQVLYGRDGKIITEFEVGTKNLTHDAGREMLKNKHKYIGKMATVEYFELSEYLVPRFGKLKDFRG